MPFGKLQFRPGVDRETTSYTNEGGWFDCDKIRFRGGVPEKIGGWNRKSAKSFLGTARLLHPWVTLDGDTLVGVGTNLKYYIERGGAYSDITPLRLSETGETTFEATDGEYRVLVTHSSHGAVVNDFVTFRAATSLGGTITADVLNQEYQIVEVVDGNSFYIEARAAGTSIDSITVDGELSPSYVTANASDTGDGGVAVEADFQINTGLNTVVFGVGWGSGTWSRGTWGSASNLPVASNEVRFWSSDNFGEDLLLNVRDGGVYYWDKSSGLTARAVALEDLSGASAAPTLAKQIMVSDRDRHVLAFGCDSEASPGVQDPLLIRFSDQESVTDWAATATNAAGDIRLGSGSEIVSAVGTRQQTIVFTDTSLYAVQYLGPPFTFGSSLISSNITIRGPKAAVSVGDTVFWMGQAEFYAYGGTVERIPCSVRDYVFNDFNEAQAEKTFACLNSEHSEVWWFYPSASSFVTDRYVVYNYQERVWYYGTLTRTAWTDRGVLPLPVAAALDNYLYFHETGFDDGSTNPASPLPAYVESSPIDLGDGDQFMFISRMIPDLTFRDATTKEVQITLDVRNFQNGAYTASSMQTVDETTTQLFYRLRGRQMRFKIASEGLGVTWRLGSPRVDVKPDGRR